MKDIQVIENFDGWDEWYVNNEVKIEGELTKLKLYENQGVILETNGAVDHGIVKGNKIIRIKHYYKPSGVSPRNSEQTIALELLRDKKIPLKILSGVAGSGKTMLACAHAIESLKKGSMAKIVIAKSMTPVGRDIGYLKGSMEDKVRPWLGPFYDNFLNCGIPPYELDEMIEEGEIEITPITFLQGRSISNAIILIDEVQNLDMNIIKQVVTRAAEGSEVILLGDQTQVFEHRNKDASIFNLLRLGRKSPLVGSVHLEESLRSPLAQWAIETL